MQESQISLRDLQTENENLKNEVKKLEKLVLESTGAGWYNLNYCLFEDMLNVINQAVIVTDQNDKIEYINDFAIELYGYSREEAIGKSPLDIICPIDLLEVAKNRIDKIKKGSRIIGEFRAVNKSGRIFSVRSVSSPIFNRDGEFVGIFGESEDISKRVEKENELKKFRTAVENSPVTITITDPEGIIEYVNPQFTNITGFEKDEVIGQNPRILKTDKTPKETYVDLWNTITKGKIWKGEFVNKKKNGEEYCEEAIIKPILNEQDEIINFVTIKSDITQRRLYEEMLKSSNLKLEGLNATKNKLFGIITHFLRNPLLEISLNADLLDNYIVKMTVLERQSSIQKIKNMSYFLNELLENIMLWAKLETEELSLNFEKFTIYDVAQISIDSIIRTHRDKTLNVSNLIPEDVTVYADLNAVNIIIRNILKNFFIFSNDNSNIEIGAFDRLNPDKTFFYFKCDGMGLSQDIFKQLETLTPQVLFSGTNKELEIGLNFLIMKEFVEKQGWKVWGEKNSNNECNFYISLPK